MQVKSFLLFIGFIGIHGAINAQQYSVHLLIAKASDKAKEYKSAKRDYSMLVDRYSEDCGSSTYCFDRAVSKAKDTSKLFQVSKEMDNICDQAAESFRKKPVKLSESERYELNESCGEYANSGNKFIGSDLHKFIKK